MRNIIEYRESLLDKIRIDKGSAKLIEVFSYIAKSDIDRAAELINDDNLDYATLFLLKDEINTNAIKEKLNVRNKAAIEITELIISGNKNSIINENAAYEYIQITYSVLRWILETGAYDDGLSNEYDEVLDISAAILVNIYRDKNILPYIADLIFQRNRKASYKNDLIWAFFEARDTNSLAFIANYLKSPINKDRALALKLLSFIPGLALSGEAAEKQQVFNSWIQDNNLFLFYKGDTYQQTSTPTPYVVILEAKYLCKIVSTYTGKIISTMSQEEKQKLEGFTKLDDPYKLLLSSFSYALYSRSIEQWRQWIRLPIEEQIRAAEGRDIR